MQYISPSGQNSVLVDVAVSAMEELMRIAQLGEPLWVPSMDRNSFELNEDEYLSLFSRRKTNGFKSEASRHSIFVAASAANVAHILMDVVYIYIYILVCMHDVCTII